MTLTLTFGYENQIQVQVNVCANCEMIPSRRRIQYAKNLLSEITMTLTCDHQNVISSLFSPSEYLYQI